MEAGPGEDAGWESDWDGPMEFRNHEFFVQMLPVLRKYECPEVHAQVLDKIARGWKTYAGQWSEEEKFLEDHYRPVVAACGGIYPERLYECFAVGWEIIKYQGQSTEKIESIVETTPALAASLAKRYCNIMINARRETEQAKSKMHSVLDGAVDPHGFEEARRSRAASEASKSG